MYLIQTTIYKYGQIYEYSNKPKITILGIIKRMQKTRENTYICINVTNLETDETRIVWDNKKNQTLFGNS